MSNINLLPWRSEMIFYKNNIFYLMSAIGATIVIVLLLIFNTYIKILLSVNQKGIDYLNSEIALYQGQTKEINGLKERRKVLLNRLEVINSLQSRRCNVVNILDKVVKCIPEGVILKNLEMKDNNLILSGKSESNSRVSLLMRNLENSKVFYNPTLQEIKAPQAGGQDTAHGISFLLEVHITG